VFDEDARSRATSALGRTRLSVPDAVLRRPDKPSIAPLRFDDDALPTTTIAARLAASQQEPGWIVGEISLEELWRMVDRIRHGTPDREAADGGDRAGPARHNSRGLPLGPIVHPAHLRADACDAIDRGRQAGHAGHAERPRRDPRAWRRVQLDGRQARRAAGEH